MLRLSMMILFAAVVLCILSAQDFNPIVKTMDGRLDDWGNGQHWTVSAIPGQKYLYDNEAQGDIRRNYPNGSYTSGPDNDKFEVSHYPGDPYNPPLPEDAVFLPSPMGSGFNLISALIAFDPTIEGGTYYLAFDLPGPTNDNLSDGFWNDYIEFLTGVKYYPIPFDCDCNENRSTVDNLASGGMGSIVDDKVEELFPEDYMTYLWIGADPEDLLYLKDQSYNPPESHDGSLAHNPFPDGKANPLGFPIIVTLSSAAITGAYKWEAYIPSVYTLSGTDIIVGDNNPGTPDLGLMTESDPMSIPENAPNRPNPRYDIEVSLSGIIDVIFPMIDPNSTGYAMTEYDLYHAAAYFMADTDGDVSGREWIRVGLDVPNALMQDAPDLSATGGMVDFHLNAGATNAGRNYLMLAGVTGTYPGYPLPGGSTTLPLNWDIFTDFALALANTVIFPGFMGTMDGNGQITAQLYWPGPSMPPGSVGTIIYFTYCLGWPWDFASNPVEIEIVP
ncbi:MAG: hypothetical protein ABIK28_13985 [Planctomycetota bacterium]